MTWTIEFSQEVERWLDSLSTAGRAEAYLALEQLEEHGNLLRMPWSRPLRDKLFELRFDCEDRNVRITYTFNPERRIITLTQFHKQRNNEQRELIRARRALKRRQSEH